MPERMSPPRTRGGSPYALSEVMELVRSAPHTRG
jgi:hypothetical protein